MRFVLRNMQMRTMDLEPIFLALGDPSSTAASAAGFIVLSIPCSPGQGMHKPGKRFPVWRLGAAGHSTCSTRIFLVLHIFAHLIRIITDDLKPDNSLLRLVFFTARGPLTPSTCCPNLVTCGWISNISGWCQIMMYGRSSYRA